MTRAMDAEITNWLGTDTKWFGLDTNRLENRHQLAPNVATNRFSGGHLLGKQWTPTGSADSREVPTPSTLNRRVAWSYESLLQHLTRIKRNHTTGRMAFFVWYIGLEERRAAAPRGPSPLPTSLPRHLKAAGNSLTRSSNDLRRNQARMALLSRRSCTAARRGPLASSASRQIAVDRW